MSRRVRSDDQDFGSDSFLDIIANIVGILIILIVVAGVKVARQSEVVVTSSAEVAVADTDEPPVSTTPVPVDVAVVDTVTDTASEQPDSSATEDVEVEIAELRLHLDDSQQKTIQSEAELKELQTQLSELESRKQVQQQQVAKDIEAQDRLATEVLGLRTSLSKTDGSVVQFETTLSSLSKRQQYVASALRQVAYETRELQEVLDQLDDQKQSSGDRINHRLSPVGQEVSEGELHFRLSEGRVAHIPLDSLLERLKAQVTARRNVVMKFHRYEGMVGPVGGFRMQYTVQRQSVSALQALQYGQGAYRMSVARWTILPAETLVAEPVDEALGIGSRFRQILEATAPGTAVTVWLYPDDFRHFAALRELTHNLNLRIAARPLPEGTPIAGSPNGSRSTSQ